MPKPRKQLISLDATPYYHCVSRCVRRAFLCGFDTLTQTSYEHRRQWVEDRILFLGSIFAIEICAFAVMSNHVHMVLHINKAKSLQWTTHQVCERWHQLYKGTPLTHKYLKNDELTSAEREAAETKIAGWRDQLCDISWFMRALNEPIARQANAEDNCTGRFWEGRFKSQALLDEKALAACLAYVDLNPIHAKIAETPESSDHTSVKLRINKMKETDEQPETLMPFIGNTREFMPQGLPFHLHDYLNLIDWTGRAIRENKRGAIANNLPPILNRIDIEPQKWITLTTQFENRFKSLVSGKIENLRSAASVLGYKRTPGIARVKASFG